MNRTRKYVWVRVAVVIALIVATTAPVRAGAAHASHRLDRLDVRLRAAVDTGASEPARVIIRVRPGGRAALRDSLVAHGDQILVEHDALDALTALVHADDLTALADNDTVRSISADAVVRPHGLLGGLLGLVVALLNVVG